LLYCYQIVSGSRATFAGRVRSRTATITANAYEYAKQRLLDGRFPPGILLSENEIARDLGISRTPVREAFLLLEAEGLLELYPRRGALVTPISPTEADDVLEARLLIEGHCAAAIREPDPSLDAALSEAIAGQELAVAGDEPQSHVFTLHDREFHRAIVSFHGNEMLTRQYDALRDRQQRIAAVAVSRSYARIVQFILEHRTIAAALADADGARAAELIGDHLHHARDLVRRARD
jgi:DNA-binding GntR family transcriptional regulator